MKKVAITLRDHQAEAIERIRREQNIPRSHVIQEAVEEYLAARRDKDAVRTYEEGYRRIPEREEADSYADHAADVLGDEDWA